MSPSRHLDVVVLGAGIQGVCVTLALAAAGHRVTIVDAAEDCLRRTSVRNEGKIHLGLVYANDPSGRTAELMLDGACAFADLIEGWIGHPLPWASLSSRPFTYAVLEDSLLSADALFDAYTRLDSNFAARDRAHYLGTAPERLWREIDLRDLRSQFAPGAITAAAATAEVALDTQGLAEELRAALHAHPGVETRYGHTVRSADRTPTGFRVGGTRVDGEPWSLESPVVVNCLWGNRIALDAHLGIAPSRPWVYRLKYRVLGRLPAELEDLPSLTLVLGRFGDIVVHPGRPTYLSWYPACLAGWASSPAPPEDWADACAGRDDRAEARHLARATLAGLADIVPALADFEVETIDAGIIAAWGTTDIDDPESELHERFDIGVHAHDGWYSIDTGKYTTAPLFAAKLAALVDPPT